MEYNEYAKTIVDNFYERLQTVKDEVNKTDGSFDISINALKESRTYIDALQHVVNELKQEEHDLTQDVYNKFKNKGYVHSIKF